MHSIIDSTDYYELSNLLKLVSEKLESLRPPPAPSEQNLWWRTPIQYESRYNSFQSINSRHKRRDRHWALYAGPYDQRDNYLYHLQPNSGVPVSVVTGGNMNSGEPVVSVCVNDGPKCEWGKSSSEYGEPENECADSVSESKVECDESVSESKVECHESVSESENVSVSENGESESGECGECGGPLCISRTCPCRSRSTSQDKTVATQEECESDQWSTDSESEIPTPSPYMEMSRLMLNEYILNNPELSGVVHQYFPNVPLGAKVRLEWVPNPKRNKPKGKTKCKK